MQLPPLLILAEDTSAHFGGEAVLPLHYFRRLLERGYDCLLLTHERNRDGLLSQFPDQQARMFFVPDTRLHKLLWAITARSPSVVGRVITGPIAKLLTQFIARRIASRLIRERGIRLIHQPAPVSPKDLSLLFGLGVPVVIGPLNGGMCYPPGFAHLEGRAGRVAISIARTLSNILHFALPGKRYAHTVLVANERTRRALPAGIRAQVHQLVENGVDLSLWQSSHNTKPHTDQLISFVFVGRLIELKAVDHLLTAFREVMDQTPARLDIFGDGVERPKLEALVDKLNLRSSVTFHGWVDQKTIASRLRSTDVFVLPSLHECGGAVVLEAMAAGVPVIATRWGGPADYLDDATGILVEPTNPQQFPQDLAAAMLKLAVDPHLRHQLSQNAKTKVQEHFDWEKKIDRILEIYADAVASR